jgi:PAS domain S-box-containing protein
MPLITGDGSRLGTICVIDRRPRVLGDGQRDGLRRLAALLSALLDKRLTERRLAASEARCRLALRGASAGEAHLARAQRIAGVGSAEVYFDDDRWIWSDQLYRIYGVDRDLVTPSLELLMSIVHEEDRALVRGGIEAARRGVTPDPIEYRIVRGDGSLRVLHREVELIRDDDGAVIGAIATKRDVTEMRAAERQRAELERQVLRMQRMDALGTLAGGVAHDINNLLLPIFAMTDELMRSVPAGSREHEYISLIRQAGTRARDLVRRLLTYARCDQAKPEPIDLAEFVAQALPLLRSSVPATVVLRQKMEPVPSILADEGQLHQVLLNLVTNSAQAMGRDGGHITIEVQPATNGAGDAHPSGVRLAVVDDGCGMDGEIRRRAFEPFFTTKSIESGTGLGLSIVQGIVAGHGGTIDLKSAPGQGTRVDIRFPAA